MCDEDCCEARDYASGDPSCIFLLILQWKSDAYGYQMIKNQHEHEELWFKSREALIERQKARKDGQKKLDDVL